MDYTYLLIGLGIIIVLFIIGKIFAIITRIFIIILIVAAIAVGFFFWHNNNKEINSQKTSYITTSLFCF